MQRNICNGTLCALVRCGSIYFQMFVMFRDTTASTYLHFNRKFYRNLAMRQKNVEKVGKKKKKT